MSLSRRIQAAVRGAIEGWKHAQPVVEQSITIEAPNITPDHVKEHVSQLTRDQIAQTHDLSLEIRLIRDVRRRS